MSSRCSDCIVGILGCRGRFVKLSVPIFFFYIISGNVLSGLLLLFLLLLDIIVVIVFRTSVFSTPALPQITVKVLEGHQPLGTQQEAVSEVELERHLMGPGVRRVPLREGRVRATLFLPPGPGPFPGVIDMFGTAGGLMEFRAGEILLLLHIFFLFFIIPSLLF